MSDQGSRVAATMYGIRGHVRRTPAETEILRRLAEQEDAERRDWRRVWGLK